MTIKRKTGSEGPKHDPYSFTEWTIVRSDGLEVKVHSGLGEWMSIKGEYMRYDTSRDIPSLFAAIVGFPAAKLEAYYERIHNRCKNCGCTRTESQPGYPGESLNVCTQCGNIVSSDFNESEII